MRGGHLQTLVPYFLPRIADPQTGVCHIFDTRDDDQIAVIDDQFESWQPGDRVVIAMHGLTGSHESGYMIRLRNELEFLNTRLFRVDMRGFGDSTFISKGHSNAGSHNDLEDVIREVITLCPQSPITIVAFSLGANIALQYLGSRALHIPENVDSAIAAAPPIDLPYCAWHLRRGLNRIYDRSFIRTLHAQLQLRRRKVPDLVDLDVLPMPRRLLQFDDQFTAVVCGYSGARDYYEQCSSAPLLTSIDIPTVILIAENDPVVPVSMFENWPASESINIVRTRSGGHLGYVGRSFGTGPRWLERKIAACIAQLPRTMADEHEQQTTIAR